MDNVSLLASQKTSIITIDGKEYPVIVCAPGARAAKLPSAKMSRRDTVAVYLPNSPRAENYRMDVATARLLRTSGMCNFEDRGRAIRLKSLAVFEPSGATIKMSEVLTNAGVNGASRTARMTEAQRLKNTNRSGRREPEDFIERAEMKIALWPLIGSGRAVRTGPAPDAKAYRVAMDLQRYASRNRDCSICQGDGCAVCCHEEIQPTHAGVRPAMTR
jgi:hypothetical protein